eukprot:jgi/Ulvmu1/9738/UM055_0078.1
MDLRKASHLCKAPWMQMPERPRRSACCARALHRDEGLTGDDAAFMEELASLRTRLQKPDKSKRRMLEITWQVRGGAAKEGPPKTCNACESSGTVECKYCHGTGVMQLGDMLYCSETGCSVCPVCGGDGQAECKHCLGSGFRASWLDDFQDD